ncbi:hypothetical protein PHISP_07695 [Aspergillus sp. HF37]|nr:hypothetical protein PHISP_07695 [Aspergillus sp. HF37]
MVPRAHTNKPTSADRGPADENQTDLNSLNVLGTAPPPTTAIDACLGTGFQFNNGVEVRNGDGVLLVGGEAFAWRPWLATSGSGSTDAGPGPGPKTDEAKAGMVNRRGQFEVDELVWGLLGVVWPRPDLLLVGTGASIFPLSLDTKRHINSHGVRVEVLDTRNAAAQFNLLATERGVSEIAAALIPIGWSGR